MSADQMVFLCLLTFVVGVLMANWSGRSRNARRGAFVVKSQGLPRGVRPPSGSLTPPKTDEEV